MTEYTIRLKDGRRLAYAQYGEPSARPVLYFHGTPSSRLEPLLLEVYGINLSHLLAEAGLRLIAVDRPGMGLSSFNPRGSFLSFADDARELLDYLQISQCPVLCWSGGGPYALAVAHRHPDRISQLQIICGFAKPFDRPVFRQMGLNKWYFFFARRVPLLLKPVLAFLHRKEVRRTFPQWISGLPYVDYVLLKKVSDLQKLARLTLKEATRGGPKGPVYEARSYYRPFGFPLSSIRQPVHYWWGTEDMSVIRLHPEAIERQVPTHIMHYREREGHISLYVHHFREVLQSISSSPVVF